MIESVFVFASLPFLTLMGFSRLMENFSKFWDKKCRNKKWFFSLFAQESGHPMNFVSCAGVLYVISFHHCVCVCRGPCLGWIGCASLFGHLCLNWILDLLPPRMMGNRLDLPVE